MEALNIAATSRSPRVSFDPEQHKFEISGESRPENASSFYKPILAWIKAMEDAFDAKPGAFSNPLSFDFSLDYFNSTSAKFILDFCKKIGHLHAKGLHLTVHWLYEEDDEDMLEVGKEMARMARIPFEYVEIKIDESQHKP